MNLIEKHSVKNIDKPIRLQEYAVAIFKTLPTKSGIKKAIKKGFILVNRKKATTALFIKGGETIELFEDENKPDLKKLELTLNVLFEDDYLAVVYKPAGVLVSGNSFVTIDNALTQNLQKSTQLDAVRPRPVHRLDYPTSGVLLVGKTRASIIALNKLFEHKKIQKTYHAISIGEMKTNGTINTTIDSKEALTEYNILKTVTSERFGFLNLVELQPKTGRKHQIRIHLSEIGNQILGDKEHGKEELILRGKGLYLHASFLKFKHPFTQEILTPKSNLPKKFISIFS